GARPCNGALHVRLLRKHSALQERTAADSHLSRARSTRCAASRRWPSRARDARLGPRGARSRRRPHPPASRVHSRRSARTLSQRGRQDRDSVRQRVELGQRHARAIDESQRARPASRCAAGATSSRRPPLAAALRRFAHSRANARRDERPGTTGRTRAAGSIALRLGRHRTHDAALLSAQPRAERRPRDLQPSNSIRRTRDDSRLIGNMSASGPNMELTPVPASRTRATSATESLGRTAARSVGWVVVDRWGTRIASLLTILVLGRLLTPADFGLVALAAIFMTFAGIFVEQGFGKALIQRETLTAKHSDSAFWASLAMAIAMTAGTILVAPIVAAAADAPELAAVLRWLSIGLIINALTCTPYALLERDFKFKTLA